jgi:hypothetical protein
VKEDRVERIDEIFVLANDAERTGDVDDFIFEDESYRCSER